MAVRPKYKILLVEDNPEVSELVANLLQDLGQEVAVAHHGSEALKILHEHGGAFNLILTDIVMPELNGIDLARQVKEKWPDTPIVLANRSDERSDGMTGGSTD